MSSPHDFDFLHGEWQVVNRRRTDFLDSDSGWEEFPATHWCRPLFDGAANVDEIDMPHLGAKGLTLRLFDVETKEWSLSWSSSRSGRLFPPVLGRFDGDHGLFHGDDTHDGKDVRVRYVWAGVSPVSARWEQAFSVDDGQTWLTNWTMDFSRPSAS
ncbi:MULTISPECIES: hypothetical protein [unclassified Streptomyces]|uniref:hypothetical protein n=1 Tax=unclassified Streptomyces TaxID=2593676 RepID=UPI00224E031E|nr:MULTISPECIES: hypothetical protein [unclassified Streptomyces]MCX4885027.1 hypothetical protein [Streptomyces sp. NBC_00847]MCX5052747.1 hypothetical protein [Streptomyces sp. NBC_00474]MCX5062569.1 hypothetical protein [Streptomyces sp. NBC_00452]MCX5250199.1 hypothetical protein [Streptomyces sp. NBC_00201]MCX5291823.1 hypothetical protein [Streptomyces sp. NBC_00183]